MKSLWVFMCRVFGRLLVREKPLGIYLQGPWTALSPHRARATGHSRKGSSQPWDANAQGFSAEVPEQKQGLSADFIGHARCADPCPAVWGAGRRGPGFPRARRCQGLEHSVPFLPVSPSTFGAPLVGDEGPQRFIRRSVFPWLEPCRISRLRGCAHPTPPKTTAGCSLLPEPRPAQWASAQDTGPGLRAGCHHRACPGWLVTAAQG